MKDKSEENTINNLIVNKIVEKETRKHKIQRFYLLSKIFKLLLSKDLKLFYEKENG